MRRREFITLIGGTAAMWPLAAGAQQPDRMRRIGVLMNIAENDPQSAVRTLAFERDLKERGWTLGNNIKIDYRWAAGNANLYRKYAPELVALAPDVLVATGGTGVGALQQVTSTIPIVFLGTSDPVNRGLIASMARPGGNTTGFILFEYSICGKWLELLKQIAPSVSRVAVVRDPVEFSGVGEMAAIQTAAPSFGVELSPVDARDGKEIERAITTFAHGSNGGLIVTLSGSAIGNRKLIITLAAQHRLPTVYPDRIFVTDGGLISYGPDEIDQYRHAAGYVDRILKGEKPGDLPVQAPTKYELVINLKTAKALGLTIPQALLAAADQVIE
jgi:putative ABC transport system substrate-binding protein